MQDHRKILKQLKMGTTEILILAALTHGDRYGYEISREVFERSNGFFEFKQGISVPDLTAHGGVWIGSQLLEELRRRRPGS